MITTTNTRKKKYVACGASYWVRACFGPKTLKTHNVRKRALNLGPWIAGQILAGSKVCGITDPQTKRQLLDPVFAHNKLIAILKQSKDEVARLAPCYFIFWVMVGGSNPRKEKNYDQSTGKCWNPNLPPDAEVTRRRSIPPQRAAIVYVGPDKASKLRIYASEDAWHKSKEAQ